MELTILCLFSLLIPCAYVCGLEDRCTVVKDYVNLKGQATLTVLAPLHGVNCSRINVDVLALVEIVRWNIVTFNEASSFTIGLQVLDTCSTRSFIPTLTLSSLLMTGSSFNLGILSFLNYSETLQVSRITKALNVVLYTPTQDFSADTSVLSWYVYYRRPLVQIAATVAKRLGNEILIIYPEELGDQEALMLALKEVCVNEPKMVVKELKKTGCDELKAHSVILYGQQVFAFASWCNSTDLTFILVNYLPEKSVVKDLSRRNTVYVIEEVFPNTREIYRHLRLEMQNPNSWLTKQLKIHNRSQPETYEALSMSQPQSLPTFTMTSHILQAFRQAQQWNCRGDTPSLCNQLTKMSMDRWRQQLLNFNYTVPIGNELIIHERIGTVTRNASYEILAYRRKHAAFERIGTYRDGQLNMRFSLNVSLTIKSPCSCSGSTMANSTSVIENSRPNANEDEGLLMEIDSKDFAKMYPYAVTVTVAVLSIGTVLSVAFSFRQVFH